MSLLNKNAITLNSLILYFSLTLETCCSVFVALLVFENMIDKIVKFIQYCSLIKCLDKEIREYKFMRKVNTVMQFYVKPGCGKFHFLGGKKVILCQRLKSKVYNTCVVCIVKYLTYKIANIQSITHFLHFDIIYFLILLFVVFDKRCLKMGRTLLLTK